MAYTDDDNTEYPTVPTGGPKIGDSKAKIQDRAVGPDRTDLVPPEQWTDLDN